MKKLLGFIITIIVITICYKILHKNKIATHSQSFNNKYPSLLANQYYNNLTKAAASSPTFTKANTKSLKDQLIGPITNQFGIGDDMLSYIIRTIPASNESALYAAIRLAQLNQALVLSETQNQAIHNARKADIGVNCLCIIYGIKACGKIIKGIDSLMTNSLERRNQDHKIRTFLAWQLIGNPDISMEQMAKICKNTDY